MAHARVWYVVPPIVALLGAVSCAAEENKNCSNQIHYLSDTDDAYRYLEARQRAIYEANPGIADPFSREELRKPKATNTLDELIDKLAHQGCDADGKNCVGDPILYKHLAEEVKCANLPTRFKSPIFFVLIMTYLQAFEPIRRKDFPQREVIRFGSLPTGTIDAQAMKPLGIGSPIVILNRDLFFFTGAFSKSISNAIPIERVGGAVAIKYKPEAIAERLRENPGIVEDFADAMSRMIRRGSPRGAHEMFLDADHNRLHARLVSAMDMFIISHEDAHVLLGHVSKGSISYAFHGDNMVEAKDQANDAAAENTITVLTRSRQQELDADALGYRLLIKSQTLPNEAANPVDLMVALAAANVVFAIIDSADRYSRAANGASFSDASHPSAVDRKKSFDSAYKELAAQGGPLKDMPDLRPVFDVSLDSLLAMADPIIRTKLGLSAAPK